MAVFAVIPLRDASLYPHIIIEAPDGLRVTFLHRGRPKATQCEADVAKFVAIIQAKCAPCKIVEKNCLDKLEPDQSQMLAAAPLDVPSARLPDGIVTFKSPNPNVALAVCRESERQASMGPRENTPSRLGWRRGVPSPRLRGPRADRLWLRAKAAMGRA